MHTPSPRPEKGEGDALKKTRRQFKSFDTYTGTDTHRRRRVGDLGPPTLVRGGSLGLSVLGRTGTGNWTQADPVSSPGRDVRARVWHTQAQAPRRAQGEDHRTQGLVRQKNEEFIENIDSVFNLGEW